MGLFSSQLVLILVREGAGLLAWGPGYWGPPKRFGAPSEITHLRLVAA